jgi:general secretion pathway protein A
MLNHAAILTLTDSKGGIHQVVLAAIQGTEATIDVGPDVLSVPVAELTALWSGEYLLLWKPQIGTLKSFSRGMQDKDVIWLRKSLASIQGIPVEPVTSEYFDDVLEARIREYQASRNLTVDGLVGQQTQIVMNSDLASDEPRLKGSN